MIERESGYDKWLEVHKKTSEIEHEIRQLDQKRTELYAKRDKLNSTLWMEIPYHDLLPYMLSAGIKVIRVQSANEAYCHKEKAWINDDGKLMIGSYEQNDRFPSTRPLFIPKYSTMD